MQAMQETHIWSLGWEHPLEGETAVHSTVLTWKIPWTVEPARLQSMESQKNWAQLSDGEECIYYYDLAFINSWVHFTSANVLKFQIWVNPGVSRKNWQGLWDPCFLKHFCPWGKRKMAPKSMWLVFLISCVASTQVLDGEYQLLSWNWAHSQCSLYGLTVVKPSSIKCRL